jgi:hypothetical protein
MKKSKSSLNGLVISAIFVTSLMIVTGCGKNDEENWIISSAKCVFVDHHINTDGQLIEGNYQGGLNIDFPTYIFEETSKKLSGQFNFEINKSLKLIYGDGRSLSGVVGSGAATGLYGIYDFPYKKGNIEIKK